MSASTYYGRDGVRERVHMGWRFLGFTVYSRLLLCDLGSQTTYG